MHDFNYKFYKLKITTVYKLYLRINKTNDEIRFKLMVCMRLKAHIVETPRMANWIFQMSLITVMITFTDVNKMLMGFASLSSLGLPRVRPTA